MKAAQYLQARMAEEAGGSLAPVLVALGVGVLLLSPFLAHVSTRMLAGKAANQQLDAQYAADSGVEYTLWRLANDPSFASAVNAAYPNPYPTSPDLLTLNQQSASLQASAVTPPGWSQLADAPGGVGQGGALAGDSSGVVYGLQGSGTAFWRFSIGGGAWQARAGAPGDPKKRDGMASAGSGSVYVLPQAKDQYWRFNVSANDWSSPPTIQQPPKNGDKGGTIAYDGNRFIYGLFDANSDNFWRYDTWNNAWLPRADFPAMLGDGMSVTAAGGFVYGLAGGNRDGFYRYSVAGDSWSALANAPGNVSQGGALVYTGGSRIYAFQGGSSAFWIYSLSSGAWLSSQAAPFAVGSGGSLAYAGGDYLYAFPGGGSSQFWRYMVSDPVYDITSSVGGQATLVRVRISGPTSSTILWWTMP